MKLTLDALLEEWIGGITEPIPDTPQLPVGMLVRFTGPRDPAQWLCGSAVDFDWSLVHDRVGVIRAYRGVMPSMAGGRFKHPASHLYEVMFSPTQFIPTVVCCDRTIEPLD